MCGADIRLADFTEADLFGADMRDVTTQWRDEKPDLLAATNYIFVKCSASLMEQLHLTPTVRDEDPFKGRPDRAKAGLASSADDNTCEHNERLKQKCLNGYDLTGMCLDGLELRQWSFDDTNCERASFRRAHLTECSFKNSVLDHARFDEARIDGCNFTKAVMNSTELSGAKFHDTLMLGSTLHSSIIVGTSFSGSDLTKCHFKRATVENTDFAGAKLVGCNFSQAVLQDVILKGANIQGSEFQLAEKMLRVSVTDACNYRLAMYGTPFLNKLNVPDPENHNRRVAQRDFSGLDFSGCDLTSADLSGSNLSGAILIGATMDKACLKDATLLNARLDRALLREADLTHANLTAAHLSEACLDDSTAQGIILTNADMRKASARRVSMTDGTFRGTMLRDAILESASLEKALFLYSDQLAGTNINSTKLPDDLSMLGGLTNIEGITTSARGLLLAQILLCAYATVQVMSISDADLLANRRVLSSPVLDIHAPVLFFSLGCPVVLLAMFIWVHFYFQHLWDELARLPAVFQDSRPIYQKVYPWFLNTFVSAHFPILKIDRPLWIHVQIWCSVLVTWWLVPITIALLWFKYLVAHDFKWTSLQLIVLVISFMSSAFLQLLAGATLRGEVRKPFWVTHPGGPDEQRIAQSRQIRIVASALAIIVVMFIISYISINGCVPPTANDGWLRRYFGSAWSGSCVAAQLVNAEVSTKGPGWRGDEKAAVTGANLSRRNLAGAKAAQAFFAKAILNDAHLERADLRLADLRWCDLSSAHLLGADLTGADLRWANLRNADFTGAKLQGMKIQGADVQGVKGLSRTQLAAAATTPN